MRLWSSAAVLALLLGSVLSAQEENAFDYYQTAVDLLPADPATDDAAQRGREMAIEAAFALEEVKDALEELRLGLRHECVMPAVTSFDQTLPYLAGFRKLARALIVEGWMYEEEGQWRRALQSYLDMLKLGQDSAREGALIHKLVSIAIEAIAWREMEQWLSRAQATEAELEELLGFLAEHEAKEASFVEVLQWEAQFTRLGVKDLAENPEKSEDIAKLLGLKPGTPMDGVLREVEKYYDQAVEWARKPYPEAKANPVPVPSDSPVARTLLPAIDRALDAVTTGTTRCRGIRLLAALKLHYVRHGAWPEDLSALVPDIIPRPVNDPFTERPFVYRPGGEVAVVYSLGPDQSDDDGMLAPAEAGVREPPDIVFQVRAEPEEAEE